jgi:transposase
MQDIDEVYHRKLKATREELLEACNGHITAHHAYMLRLIKRDIEAAEAVISDVDSKVREILSPYNHVIELLKDIPGLNVKSIEDPVAETGLDMSVFPNEKHLCSWVGIAPGNNESAGKKKKWAHNPRQQAG